MSVYYASGIGKETVILKVVVWNAVRMKLQVHLPKKELWGHAWKGKMRKNEEKCGGLGCCDSTETLCLKELKSWWYTTFCS
ncbi:hypothetical protein BVC80_1751g93 [Macleaya cordata]|uniref:Uncharacterized protein n=1 Tax=Macleaya cordata TaxID=56857 RepID=A0A200QHN9_MACCD|nr:hypothetical protein BVC80_1751g93 [Macleaya cordata]